MHMKSMRSCPLGFAAVVTAWVLIVIPAAAGLDDPAGTLVVRVDGVRTRDGGDLIVALFDRESGWLDPDSTVARTVLPVPADTARIVFADIPYDTSYAVQVIHDRNRNGKFDMRWFPYPKPKEGGGISNNHVRRGKPEYEKARFTLADSSMTIHIHMYY
jgi:uncharacterized protein (DUF2141 family)